MIAKNAKVVKEISACNTTAKKVVMVSESYWNSIRSVAHELRKKKGKNLEDAAWRISNLVLMG